MMKTEMIPSSLILIEPINFLINLETSADNEYMKVVDIFGEKLSNQVIQEHKSFTNTLKEAGINHKIYKQINEKAYDSIFACDWFGSIKNEDFPDGIAFVFPMKYKSRRLEKNEIIIAELKITNKFFEDLSFYEEKNLAFESFGTASLDFHNRILYYNQSERCDIEVVNYFIDILNKYSSNKTYKSRIIYGVNPKSGIPIFHTGVYLAFIDKYVFFSPDFVQSKDDSDKLLMEFSESNEFKYIVILLSYDETINYCANIIEVKNMKGEFCLVMSKASDNNFSETNRKKLSSKFKFVVADIDIINQCAGGSVRCMTHMIF